jgi:hypothetical protein
MFFLNKRILPPAHINRVFGDLRIYKSELRRICQFIQGLVIYHELNILKSLVANLYYYLDRYFELDSDVIKNR